MAHDVLPYLEAVLADRGGPQAHGRLLVGDHADLLGPLVVRAGALEDFRTAIPAGLHDLRVHLVSDADDDRDGLTTLREARNGLFDDDRVEVVGVELALPAQADPAFAASTLLEILDFTAPTWIRVPLVEGWEKAFDVVAEDGTERLAVDLHAGVPQLAQFLRRAAQARVPFRLSAASGRGLVSAVRPGPDAPPALLNLLAGLRAVLDGATDAVVEALLRTADPAPLTEVVRSTSEGDAAGVRALLRDVDTADVEAVAEDLRALGLG